MVTRAIFGALVTIYMVRKLSVKEYGIYNILFALIGYISVFSSFGVLNIFQRYIPELYKKKDICSLKSLVIRGLLLRMILSATFVGLVILFSDKVGRLLQVDNWLGYLKLFSFGIVIFLEVKLLNMVLISLFLHKYQSISDMIYVLIRGGFICFFLVRGFGLTGVLCGEVIAWGVFLLMLSFFYYSKFSRLHPVEHKTKFATKRFFRYGGYSFLNQVGGVIFNVYTDYFILSAFLGPAAVGIYSFANKIITMYSRYLPHVVFQNVITPAFFTKYAETGDPKDLERMVNFLVKLSSFFLFPFAVGILVLGDKMIIHIFGSKYLDSLIPLWIVALFAVSSACVTSMGLVLKAIEKVEILLYGKIFAIYNLVADILVVKRYGVIGIAVVTGSAVLLQKIFYYLYVRKYTGFCIDWKGLITILINSILMGLLIYFLRAIITNLYTFVLVTTVGAAVYLLFAYFNKSFSQKERNVVNKIITKPIFVF